MSSASPAFADMFDVGDPETSVAEGDPPDEDDLPIVDVPEPQRVLYHIIRNCYPVPHEKINDLDQLALVYAAAAKYEMDAVTVSLGDSLEAFQETHPLQTFALACRFGLQYLARLAALQRGTHLRFRVVESAKAPHALWKDVTCASCYVTEMKGMQAGAFYRLIEYVRTKKETIFYQDPQASKRESSQSPAPVVTFQMTQFSDANIRVQSHHSHSQSTFFDLHTIVLSTSSPTLKEEIEKISVSSESSEILPILQLPEYDNILRIILASCYPCMLASMPMPTLAELPEVVVAAKKYKLFNLIDICRKSITTYTSEDPLRVYLVAAECGWKDEARTAAVRLAQLARECEYSPYLEVADTSVYFPLLKFCHEYRQVIFKLTGGVKGRVPADMWKAAEWCCEGMTGDASNFAWAVAMSLMDNGYNRGWPEIQKLHGDLLTQLAQVESLLH